MLPNETRQYWVGIITPRQGGVNNRLVHLLVFLLRGLPNLRRHRLPVRRQHVEVLLLPAEAILEGLDHIIIWPWTGSIPIGFWWFWCRWKAGIQGFSTTPKLLKSVKYWPHSGPCIDTEKFRSTIIITGWWISKHVGHILSTTSIYWYLAGGSILHVDSQLNQLI